MTCMLLDYVFDAVSCLASSKHDSLIFGFWFLQSTFPTLSLLDVVLSTLSQRQEHHTLHVSRLVGLGGVELQT